MLKTPKSDMPASEKIRQIREPETMPTWRVDIFWPVEISEDTARKKFYQATGNKIVISAEKLGVVLRNNNDWRFEASKKRRDKNWVFFDKNQGLSAPNSWMKRVGSGEPQPKHRSTGPKMDSSGVLSTWATPKARFVQNFNLARLPQSWVYVNVGCTKKNLHPK